MEGERWGWVEGVEGVEGVERVRRGGKVSVRRITDVVVSTVHVVVSTVHVVVSTVHVVVLTYLSSSSSP